MGSIFAVLCSVNERKKNRIAENWFILGFIFWFFALIALTKLSNIKEEGI